MLTRVLLTGVYVYASGVVPIGRAGVLAFAAVIGPRVRRRERHALLSLTLLLSLELPVVNRNGSVHIYVERLYVSVGLDELVLDVVLQPVVEPSLERVGSPMNPERKLPEFRGILDG